MDNNEQKSLNQIIDFRIKKIENLGMMILIHIHINLKKT